jgi:hypothetical protein
MAKLDDILKKMLSEAEGSFSCAVIDMNTRQLLGVSNQVAALTPNYLEALAVAAVELVRGKQVFAIESLLSSQLNKRINNVIDDMCVTAGETRHFMAVIPEKPSILVVLSATKDTSVGMGWVVVNRAMPSIAEQCP